MLLVKTFIAYSANKGIGLFADQLIPKNVKYWKRDEVFDNIFTPFQISSLEVIAVEYIKKHGFLETSGNWYLCNDNGRFSNHSDNPNSRNLVDEKGLVQFSVTTRDILKGEEILCDYKEICLDSKNNLGFDVSQ
mgnify:CR=1 FL=1